MQPLYIATEPFDPSCGQRWTEYIEWSGLRHLNEVVSLDGMLCSTLLPQIKDSYWPHMLNEDFMLDYFTDLDFLLQELAGLPGRKNLLCVFRNPTLEPVPPAGFGDFAVVGYDLVDVWGDASALPNCGDFPLAFSNTELVPDGGLLSSLDRALEVQVELKRTYPDEPHCNCHVWAVFRKLGR